MKRNHFSLITLLLVSSIFRVTGQDTLLLFHPTAYNLEVVQHLIDMGAINLDGYHVLGVYHAQETYDYNKASTYLDQHNIQHFSLQEITGSLKPSVLFRENSCSVQFKQLFSISRGALFMGGPDIPPVVYHEPVHLLTVVTDPFRHYFELSYLFHALGGTQDPDWKPFMAQQEKYLISGICLGMQTMNVATGGTMVQDIPTEMYGIWFSEDILSGPPEQMHRNYADKVNAGCDEPTSYHFHPIKLLKKTVLNRKIGYKSVKEPLVLSAHHQAVAKMGRGWVIAATSMDEKVIEAIEHEKFPHVFGVQFHPEKPGLYNPSIVHARSCNSTINFMETIKDTDSYRFHLAYWKYLGKVLQKNRSK